MGHGVLPRQTLNELIDTGFIKNINKKYVNPASLDLPITDEAYRLPWTFLPQDGEIIRDLLPMLSAERHDLKQHLEVGVSYLIKLAGSVRLPEGVYGYANPKSSTGRINLFCRIVADRVDMYDALSMRWEGEMWVLVRPDSFPVRLKPGLALSQVRLFDQKSFLDHLAVSTAQEGEGLLFGERNKKIQLRRHADSLMLTLAVGSTAGYQCIGSPSVLDCSKPGVHDPADYYFEKVVPRDGRLVLRRGIFYILRTRESVKVPSNLSAELRAIDPRLGEFRSHAAGYVDPGWGCGTNGKGKGRPITLEVIPFEDMLVRDGQPIARIRYEYMKAVPDVLYDDAVSNYTKQKGAQLAKFFKK
jgi:dCTP deaminase